MVFIVMGLAIGIFLNVVIDGLPARESIVVGASHCPNCQNLLAPVDLVPVLSYLWLQGRCRYCKASIPVRVPLVEMTTGILFGFLYWEFGLGMELGIALVYGNILLANSVIDLEHQLIPNVVVFPYIFVALGVLLLSPYLQPWCAPSWDW